MLDDLSYLENRTVRHEELEVTEEIKLGHGVTAGKKVNQTTNIRPLKRDFKRVERPWTLQFSPLACIHIVTSLRIGSLAKAY